MAPGPPPFTLIHRERAVVARTQIDRVTDLTNLRNHERVEFTGIWDEVDIALLVGTDCANRLACT